MKTDNKENIYFTQIRLGTSTKEEVIKRIKAEIKFESERLSKTIKRDGDFIILDVNNHIHHLKKYNDYLFEVANYQPEPGKWKTTKADTVDILVKQN